MDIANICRMLWDYRKYRDNSLVVILHIQIQKQLESTIINNKLFQYKLKFSNSRGFTINKKVKHSMVIIPGRIKGVAVTLIESFQI